MLKARVLLHINAPVYVSIASREIEDTKVLFILELDHVGRVA